jgi:mannose-6-phosphate isomerase-like protein (cupin superfamily)
MPPLVREDLNGRLITATMKPMETGEIRCRMKPDSALDMQTKAVHVTKAAALTWQGQFHRHQLQTEIYVVTKGLIAAVSWFKEGGATHKVIGEGETTTFLPGTWHDIFTTPGAEFVTIQIADVGIDVDCDREVLKEIQPDVRHHMTSIEIMLPKMVP